MTPEWIKQLPVDALGTSFAARDTLKEAGLYTIESIVTNYDLLRQILPDASDSMIRETQSKAGQYNTALNATKIKTTDTETEAEQI